MSILDAKSALWRHRKREWENVIGIGNESREESLYKSLSMRMPRLYASSRQERERLGITFEEYVAKYAPGQIKNLSRKKTFGGVSTFDPVLAEIIYRWFTPTDGSLIFDCFAGGITKGAVASAMGHHFTGIELRLPQVEVNNIHAQGMRIVPNYICDDAINIFSHIGVATQDLFITCPPYYNLEIYSDLPNDASNQPTYHDFLEILREAFNKALICLKRNRFAVVIVGDIRDEHGACYNFPGDVINIFQRSGCALLNDMVLIRADATANMRADRYMRGRKTVRVHERVLVFYNGNPANVRKYFNPII